VTPNPSRTEDNAVAASAPSMIGDHSKKCHRLSFRATGGMLSIVISIASTEAEEGQDRQNHDDETDEINQSVHEFPPCITPFTQVTIYWQSSPVPGKTCTPDLFLHFVALGLPAVTTVARQCWPLPKSGGAATYPRPLGPG
jgi:hypothetical protein